MKKKIIGIIFCTLLISVVTSNAIYVKNTDNANSTLILVRIETADGQINIPKDMEIIGHSPGNWIDIIIPDYRLQELSDMDLAYEVIIKDVIKYWTDPGDIVIDPTMGSGSTGEACKELELHFIGIEKDEKWFNVAKERLIG